MENDDDIKECTTCGDTIDEGDGVFYNDNSYCNECVFVCEGCDDTLDTERRVMVGDYIYCDNCASYCDRCSGGVSNDDTHTVDRTETWCEYCWENRSHYCGSCSESFSGDGTYVQDSSYCDDCYSDNCYWCDDCDESYTNDEPCDCRDSDGNPQGPRCQGRNACGTGRHLHQYGCKPDIEFHGKSKTNLYLGLELETEIYGDLRDATEYASQALEGIGIVKHDGSIGYLKTLNGYTNKVGKDGFEIVLQPHTHTELRDRSAQLWTALETLRTKYEARSWDAPSDCGIHIHLSRAGFSSGAHLHRFIAFIYHNPQQMMKFAGRKSLYARFNDVYTFDEYDRPVFSLKHKTGNPRLVASERYSAVNTQNEHTIELRFFRGTMNTSGVLSTLDLAQAMVEYTRELRLDDVKLGALSWDWFADYVVSNNGLYPDLYARLDKIQSVDINKPIKANA